MKKHSQVHRTPLTKCARCGEPSRKTEKVSDRIYKGGARLCPDCIVPAAQERQEELRHETETEPDMTSPITEVVSPP